MNHTILSILLALALLSGCDRATSNSGTTNDKPAEKEKFTPLQQEALKVAAQIFEQHWVRDGDSWFTSVHEPHGWAENVTIQIKDVTHVLNESRITEADRLNGIEWRGEIEIRPKASRAHAPKQTPQYQFVGWREWQDGMDFLVTNHITLMKKAGKWSGGLDGSDRDDSTKFIKPSLSALALHGNTPMAEKLAEQQTALANFKADIEGFANWAEEKSNAAKSDPSVGLKMMGELAGKLKAIKTDGLPSDLKGAWGEFSGVMGEVSDTYKRVKPDKPENTMKAIGNIMPKIMAVQRKMEPITKKLEEVGKKYNLDLTNVGPK